MEMKLSYLLRLVLRLELEQMPWQSNLDPQILIGSLVIFVTFFFSP